MVLLAAAMASAWATYVDPQNLTVTLPRFTLAVQALVQSYGRASSAAALTYYRKERVAADITGPVRLKVADVPPLEQIRSTVDWATKGLYGPSPAVKATEPVKAAASTGSAAVSTVVPVAEPSTVPDPVAVAEKLVSDAAEQLVLDQSRQTLIDAVHDDRKARAWARVTEPGACSFCLLLATRGAVYKTQDTGGFRAHTHCQCHVEPVFGSYEPTAQARAAQAVYKTSTRGKSGAAARNAFRVAIKTARDDGHPLL